MENKIEAIEQAQAAIVHLKHLYRTNQFEGLKQSVSLAHRKLMREADIYRARNTLVYNLGFLMGALDIFKEVLCCSREQNLIIEFIQTNITNKTPHFKEIILAIQEESIIQHNKLIKKLDAKEDEINSIITEMKKCGLIDILTPGDFMYYTFSDQGNKIIEVIMPFLNLLSED